MSGRGPALVLASARSRRMRVAADREALLAAVVDAIHHRGHDRVEVAVSEGERMVETAVRRAIDAGAELVVAVGGDGLVRETAAPVVGSPAVLGIVPAGTGNQLASALRIPGGPGALSTIAEGVPRAIDHGVASWAGAGSRATGAFFVACGAGLDARLVAEASQEAKRRVGIGAYVAAALGRAADLRPRPTRILVDGTVHETRTVVVLVANAGELIPGLIGPRLRVRPDDGLLDVFALYGGVVGSVHGTCERLAATGPGVGRAGIRLQGREIRVETEPAEPVQLDGDVLGWSPLEARVVPAGLRVLVPRST